MNFGKLIKNVIGLLFIPLVSSTAFSFLKIIEEFVTVNSNSLYLLIGMAVYFIFRILVSRLGSSMMEFIEVFYHELIHAFYSIICFRGIRSFFVSDSKGGELVISKSNFIIELSPYYFPIFALFPCGFKPFIVEEFQKYLVLSAGLGIGLHLSSILNDLKFEQSDIGRNGLIFSFVFILFLNIIFFGIIFSILGSGYGKIWQFFYECIKNYKEIIGFLIKNLS